MTEIEIDRRHFLLGMAGAGVVLLGGCAGSPSGSRTGPGATIDPGVDVAGLAPVTRPSIRLAGAALGFPSPFGYIAVPGYRQMSLLYDTLMWKDSTGRLMPWLASRYDRSADGLVHSFELRDGVRWHDGMPLTADDVVFTFDYYRANTLGPLVVFQPYGIDKVVALGPRQVEIHLDRPDVTFAESLAGTLPIVPRHVWSSIDDPVAVQDIAKLVGSGPYRLASFDGDGGAMSYTANDDYFLGRPFVSGIGLIPVNDDLTSLLAGEVDAAEARETGTRPDALLPFGGDAWGIIESPGGFTFPLYWNLGRGGALGDVVFRRACAMAIDRADAVDRLTGGNALAGNPGFLSPTNSFHVAVEQYAFDLAGANRLLDDAGYTRQGDGVRRHPDGTELRFELLFPGLITALAEVVKAALRKIGVELEMRSAELGPALYGRKLAGDYDMVLALYPGPSGPGPNADPDLLRPVFSSRVAKGLNSANGWVDAEFDDLAERQLATFDEAERRTMIARMQTILARDVPVLPLYYSTQFQVFRRQVFDQWYITPGAFPVGGYNRQMFVTGLKTGMVVRPTL